MKSQNKESELIEAVKKNDLALVKSVLSEIEPSDINYQDKYGETALHYATKNTDIAKALLDKGADPTIRSKPSDCFSSERDGIDSIGMAILNGDSNIVRNIIEYLKRQESPSADSSMDHPSSPAASSTALVPANPFSPLTSAGYYAENEKYTIVRNFTTPEKPPTEIAFDPILARDQLFIDLMNSDKRTFEKTTSPFSYLPTLQVRPKIDPEKSTLKDPIELSSNLHVATEREFDPELTRELIIQLHRTGKYNINGRDSFGRTPLHRAIQMRNLEAVDTLLELGANVNSEYYKVQDLQKLTQYVDKIIKKKSRQDPKVVAVEKKIFYEEPDHQSKKPKIDSYSRDDDAESIFECGDTPFMLALKSCKAGRGDEKDDDLTRKEKMEKENDFRMISMILRNPNLNFNTPGDYLQTPLHIVAEKSMYEVMKVFLKSKKFEIDSQDEFGDTALHLAARKGNIKMVNLLLEHGAFTTIINYDNATALDLLKEFNKNKLESIEREKQELITSKQQLERAGISSEREETALITLSAQKKELSSQQTSMELMCFRPLRNSSNDLLATDPQSMLFNAVKTNNLTEVTRFLNLEKVTANIKDANEITLLHMAVNNRNSEIVELLLNAGALTSAQDKLGNTPLHYATKSNQIEIVNVLLDKKSAIYSCKNTSREMAFDIAVTNKNKEMLNLFMPHFIKMMKYRDHKSFLLFDKTTLASCEKILDDEEMKKVFLDFKDEDGRSIVHIACNNDLKELVDLFKEKDLKEFFEIKDNLGKTAKNLAEERLSNPSGMASGASADRGCRQQ